MSRPVNLAGDIEGLRVGPPLEAWLAMLAEPSRAAPRAIMTGHQAEFWHPGILAKYVMAGVAAARLRSAGIPARVVWLVVDQDSNELWKIGYPMLADGGIGDAGAVSRATWSLPFRGGVSAAGAFAPDTPTAALPPMEPPTDLAAAIAALRPALPGVAAGLREIGEALRRHMDKPDAARQVAAALCDLLSPSLRPDGVLFATDLSAAAPFAEMLARMRADPRACTTSYNAAALAHPHAHIRPLAMNDEDVELPLWRMPRAQGQARQPVFAKELTGLAVSQLAPRALLMTALVRQSFCDFFIHGTGGGVYDRVTEDWLKSWLPGTALAPTAVVTATRHLEFEGPPPRTPGETDRARWNAHHARHNPGSLGDQAGQERKAQLLRQLTTARARGENPADAYRALHHFLDERRRRHAARLGALEADAAAAVRDAERTAVVYDRTWAFPLYGPGVVEDLRSEIASVAE